MGIGHAHLLNEAVNLATGNAKSGKGGPFGALITRNGEILSRAVNLVISLNDPTAHAEMLAIREACSKLGSFSLIGCELYASCEPCPMCLAAIYWARIDVVYYAATRLDAAEAGFDDQFFYNEFLKPPEERIIPLNRIILKGTKQPFADWMSYNNKTLY